jgi:hypothetical protein
VKAGSSQVIGMGQEEVPNTPVNTIAYALQKGQVYDKTGDCQYAEWI